MTLQARPTPSRFLSAEWRKLIMAQYAVAPETLTPWLPEGLELDLFEGQCFVSLIGFLFDRVRIKGLAIPFHTRFEEVNLRFYVRRVDPDGGVRRGVIFIREFVPRMAITLVANLLYEEPYATTRMRRSIVQNADALHVSYDWKYRGLWYSMAVQGSATPRPIAPETIEEFITEHYWGFTKRSRGAASQYQVEHPRWQTYPVKRYKIAVDFGALYGPAFAGLNEQEPHSILLAEGSAVSVYGGTRLGAAEAGLRQPVARPTRVRDDEDLWWRRGVIYQIYPRSFQDSNGDGVGDLRGILARLDYLQALGVDALWISPFYPSPMADFGYDVADYTAVDPLFGTLADFDALLAGIHARGLKLILDFVPNHTSDQHPWFLASRSARTDPKRDWYLWRDPAPGGGPPNNWMSNFGGSGWTFDPPTGQFYYHSFLMQQPDLNWRNAEVRAAMYAAMRFWLERGVDGFRMDVLWLLIKDDQFRDNLPNPDFTGGSSFWSILPTYTADQPETLTIVGEMREVLDQYPERVLIGEIYLGVSELMKYYGGAMLEGAQMPFNFHLILTAWQAPLIADLIRRYEAALPAGAWPNWVLGNHDQHRLATRIGAAQARVAAVLLLTLRGTPTLYCGDELGMPDARIAPDQVRDPAELNQPGLGLGRDPERSPMLWENRENAGFTAPGVATWLPLVWGWPSFTVETESADAGTSLKLYQQLLQLRRATPALHSGSVADVAEANGVLTYTRSSAEQRLQVHLNFTDQPQTLACSSGRILLSSSLDRGNESVAQHLMLGANQAIVLQLD